MDKRSLIAIREIVLDCIENSKIKDADKMELLINIYHFLDEDNYKENIQILKKYGKSKKK